MQNTQVHILRSAELFWHIIVTPSTEGVTYVFTIDTSTGQFIYSGVPGLDVFSQHRHAVQYIRKKFKAESFKTGKALIGATIEQGYIYIPIVTADKAVATLPNNHTVFEISATEIIKIPIQKSQKGQSRLNDFQDLIKDRHFYCETYDLTRPYPSTESPLNYDLEFCWNQRFRAPFEKLKCGYVCIVMLQGYMNSCEEVAFIVRRSVLNPFTRLESRGLNEDGAPGNEVECELIFFKQNNEFATNVWRRGSIPLKWKSQGILMLNHVLQPDATSLSHVYFDKLKNRFEGMKICVVSLLDNSESELTNAYGRFVSCCENMEFHTFNVNAQMDDIELFIYPLAMKSDFTEGENKQKLFLRFNCIDSLDRTNVAVFYYARALAQIRKISPEGQTFIAKCVYKSGNIIASLYTGTPAIKNKMIGHYAHINHKQFDELISVVRKIHNYMYDQEKSQSILAWIKTSNLLSFQYTFDVLHMSIISTAEMAMNKRDAMPDSLLSIHQTIEKYHGNEMIIMLSQPAIIKVISFQLFPHCIASPTSVTIKCGNNMHSQAVLIKDFMLPIVRTPILCRLSLNHASHWNIQAPHDINANNPTRFIWLEFSSCSSETVGYSNVIIEGYVQFSSIYVPPKPTQKTPDFETYNKMVKSYLTIPKKSMNQLLDLETYRIAEGITIEERNQLLPKFGHNPLIIEPKFYVNREQSTCSFKYCKKGLLNEIQVNFLAHPFFTSLLDPTPKPPHPSSFAFCTQCAQHIRQNESKIKELETNRVVTRLKTTDFRPKHWTNINDVILVSSLPYSTFLEFPAQGTGDVNSIISETSGRYTINSQNEKSFVFTLCIIPSKPAYFNISFEGEMPQSVKFLTESLIIDPEIMDQTYEFSFKTEKILNCASFVIEANPDQQQIILTRVSFYGCIKEMPESAPHWYNFPIIRTPFYPKINVLWNPESQTQIVALNKTQILKRVVFLITNNEYGQQAESLILAAYQGYNLIKSIDILVPIASIGTEFQYRVPDRISCNIVRIFYLDTIPHLVPLTLNLVYE